MMGFFFSFARGIGAALLAAVLLTLAHGAARAGNSAVIFMYHRFGEGDYPSTSITMEQFDAHLAELQAGGYVVLPLADIIDALKNGIDLPDRAVAITVDDAYLSVYERAWPKLRALGYPFTLFVATDPVDRGIRGYMSWEQIRELHENGVGIGSQTASHLHMAQSSVSDNHRDIEKSQARFQEELGFKPNLIAYPYGEAGKRVMQLARSSGFIAGLGQHSGVAAKGPNLFYLPRFALNEQYGGIDRFRLAANALALTVEDVTPADPLIEKDDENPPAFGFTVSGAPALIKSLNRLACFASHEGKLEVSRLGGESGPMRIEVRMSKPLARGRTRLNCTLPAGEGRWYWFGHQFFTLP